jgi:hypothetical protein
MPNAAVSGTIRANDDGVTAVIFELVLIGLAVALDPLPLTAFLIVLPSERGARKGAAFVFGWLASLAAVVAATILATGNSPPKPDTIPSRAALTVKLALGVALVLTGLRRQRRARAPASPKKQKKPPKWQERVDAMSPWLAMGLAPALQPWVLIGAGAATIVEAKVSTPASFLVLFGYCVLASSSYLAMEIYAVVRPARSKALMTTFRTQIETRTDQVIIVGSLILGFWLIANSAYLIVS